MKSAAWRMPWQKSGNDDTGGGNPRLFLPVPGQSTKEVAAGSALPGHAGHGLVVFQLCGRRVVCGLCRASILAGLAKKMMPEYEGGFWHFIRLPDGGGYMMPDGDRFHIVNGANWFDRTVSADAAGVILTSLVINRQLWLYHDSGDAGLTHLYRMRDAQLWRHIEFHPECNAIYAALD